MTTKVTITNCGTKRIFTISQAGFDPNRKHSEPLEEANIIESGDSFDITIDNGKPFCIVELEDD